MDRREDIVLDQAVIVLSRYAFVRSAYVFGSYARRMADGDSDLDLVVDIDKSNRGYGMEFVGLSMELEETQGLPVDLLTLDSVRRVPSFNGLPKEAVMIYERALI